MKRIQILFLLALSALGAVAFAGYECEMCPKEKPCVISEKWDRCNYATYNAWCEDGVWYRDRFPGGITAMYCPPDPEDLKPVVIPAPGQ